MPENRINSGASPQTQAATAESSQPAYEGKIQQELEQNYQASDSKGYLGRRDRLVEQFKSLSPEDAKALLQKLNTKSDPLSKLFNGKLSDATCDRLKQILQNKTGGASAKQTDAPPEAHHSSAAKNMGNAKKAEIGMESQYREANLRKQVSTNEVKNNPPQVTASGPKEVPDSQLGHERSLEEQAKLYDKYEQMIPADKLKDGPNQMNIVGMRHHDITNSKDLRTYDDRFTVIWKDKDGNKHAKVFEGATHAGQKFTRGNYEDINKDGKPDIPYIKPGSYEFKMSHSDNPSFGDHLRTVDGSRIPAWRDTNQDGKITGEELTRQNLGGGGILFHKGGTDAPISIGCQTLAPDEYQRFIDLIKQDPDKKVNYTLVDGTGNPQVAG